MRPSLFYVKVAILILKIDFDESPPLADFHQNRF